jgi:hypothetical protein
MKKKVYKNKKKKRSKINKITYLICCRGQLKSFQPEEKSDTNLKNSDINRCSCSFDSDFNLQFPRNNHGCNKVSRAEKKVKKKFYTFIPFVPYIQDKLKCPEN